MQDHDRAASCMRGMQDHDAAADDSADELPRVCERCGAAMRFYRCNLEQSVLLCSTRQCLWPLDVAEDVGVLQLPFDDPRVTRMQRLAPAAAAAAAMGDEDELEHIGNMLLRPSPAGSPAMAPAPHRQHSTADSLPPSTSLGPVSRAHDLTMLSLELPPPAAAASVDEAFAERAGERR